MLRLAVHRSVERPPHYPAGSNASSALPRVRGGDGLAGRRDRRRAAARALLRRLDHRLGEHDRDRPRGAVDRLLARRAAGRPPPEHARAVPAGPARRGAARPRAVRRATRCSTSAVDAFDDDLRRRRSSARCSGCSSWWPCRCSCSGRSRRGRSGSRSTRSRRPATVAGRLYAISTAGSLLGTLLSALLLIPLVGHAAHLPDLRARDRARRRVWGLRPLGRWALAPRGVAVLIALPLGHDQGRHGRSGRVIHEAETEYQYARVIEDDDGDAELELNEGQAIHSLCPAGHRAHRRLLGRLTSCCRSRAATKRRGAWRSSATRRAPSRALRASSSPIRASTASRSTPSCPRSGAATSA